MDHKKHVEMFKITVFWDVMPCNNLLPPTSVYKSKPGREKNGKDIGKGRTGRNQA
jgi:hypothetical protein